MAYYLVDYENVHHNGFIGIENLTQNDKLFIFYTINAETLPFSLYRKLMRTPASVKLFDVDPCEPGRSALDFQLSVFMGYILGNNKKYPPQDIYIISADLGYDANIAFYKRHLRKIGLKVQRRNTLGDRKTYKIPVINCKTKSPIKLPNIPNVSPSGTVKNEPLVPIFPDNQEDFCKQLPADLLRSVIYTRMKKYPANEINIVFNAARTNKNKINFYLNLVRALGRDKGRELYLLFSPDYDAICLTATSRTHINNHVAAAKDLSELHNKFVTVWNQSRGTKLYNLIIPYLTSPLSLSIPLSEIFKDPINDWSLNDKDAEIINNIMNETCDKATFHNTLAKHFNQKLGTEIYKLLKTYIIQN